MPRDGAFQRVQGVSLKGAKVRVQPRNYTAVKVNTGQVRAELSSAPKSGSASSTIFGVPTPTGGTERFAVQRTQVMQPKLAAAHPEIQTWSGTSLADPGTTIALDVTPMGFHAAVRGPNGQNAWYVDPAFNRPGTTTHVVYYGASVPRQSSSPVERELPQLKRDVDQQRKTVSKAAAGGLVKQRVYRLALLSDPTYADYFGFDNVTAEKATLINRVNQLYNDDAAIKLVLVDGTDALNLGVDPNTNKNLATDPDGPCGAHACYTFDDQSNEYVEGQIAYCDVGTLQRNQTVLGQLLPDGASSYDIGHIALGTNGGGIAGLGVVGSIEKAMGCTGIPTPQGDYYAIDYVAHEMGHQFGGNHTFNGTQTNCSGGNRNRGTSVEPGSGSSIMAYAGICAHDNLQPHSDPYFSQRSQTEITRYTTHLAANPVEVQDVSLTDFNEGESITLGYPGSPDTYTLTRTPGGTGPTDYNAANIKAAVMALTGARKVTIAKWGYDPYAGIYQSPEVYPAPTGFPDRTGFQVMFAGDPDPYTTNSPRTNMDNLIVTSSDPVTAHVGETAKGGPPDNLGDEVVTTTNHSPVVTAPANKTIPMRTPFKLTGSGRDSDGNKLTYLWEQNDIGGPGGTGLVSNTKRNGPLFRVFGLRANVTDAGALQSPSPGENHAGRSPSRTFPDMAQILAGNTNAKTGKCPAAPSNPTTTVPVRTVNCFSEFLPTKGYVGTYGTAHAAMHFRLTARDGRAGGGGVGHDDVTLRISQTAGPFLVSSFAKAHTSVKGGKATTIRWKVNGTQKLAPKVRILLSTDNGQAWKKVLVKRTANDGSVTAKFPKQKIAQARIMIQGLGNYFFDVNDHAFAVRK